VPLLKFNLGKCKVQEFMGSPDHETGENPLQGRHVEVVSSHAYLGVRGDSATARGSLLQLTGGRLGVCEGKAQRRLSTYI